MARGEYEKVSEPTLDTWIGNQPPLRLLSLLTLSDQKPRLFRLHEPVRTAYETDCYIAGYSRYGNRHDRRTGRNI